MTKLTDLDEVTLTVADVKGSLCAVSERARAGNASGAGAKSQEPPESCRTKLAEQTGRTDPTRI